MEFFTYIKTKGVVFETTFFKKKKSESFRRRRFRNTKKIKGFQKILNKHHTGELHKKGTILHQAPLITLFFDSPCIY